MRIPFQHTSSSPLLVRGFTLIELIVSVAIITLITSIALVQNNQFNSTLALTNLAYEVGLSIRQAQVFGISVRKFNNSTQIPYGVYFSSGTPTQYTLFADLNGNKRFDTSPNETVETAQLTQGNKIQQFCAIKNNVTDCTGALTGLSVLFERPNPDAKVFGLKGGAAVPYTSARIYLTSTNGAQRCVFVQPTGQISVETTCQ